MKHFVGAASALALFAPVAYAGGLDRSGQGINMIFEPGTAVQFALTYVDPDITGEFSATGAQSGDIGVAYVLPRASFKTAINDKLDIGFGYDEPYGAHVSYDPTYTLSNPQGQQTPDKFSAEATSNDLVGLARYKVGSGFSVLGGLRIQKLDADVSVPIKGYKLKASASTEVGYILGAAWEKPEIAARVALTYNSEIEHTLSQVETSPYTGGNPTDTESKVKTPQSINLDFQTGIAAGTLLFGNVRWADWTSTAVIPGNYPDGPPPATGPLVDYDNDSVTYNIGVGRQITEDLSLAFSVGYEAAQGGTVSDLSPTDGYISYGLGGTYSLDNAKISAGVRYIDLGDADTDNGAVFKNNSGWGAGFQVTYYLK